MITGVRILERLEFEFADLDCPLALTQCRFDQAVILMEATAKIISFFGSHAARGIIAPGASVRVLSLNGFTAKWGVNLDGASLDGLDLKGAHWSLPTLPLIAPPTPALP